MKILKLILASTSSGRKNILSTLKIPFEVIDSLVDEDKIWDKDPQILVEKRAEAKGLAVEKMLNGNYLIISADSMVVIGKKAIGKIPVIKEQKEVLLKELSGKTHKFFTAVFIKNTQTQKVWQEVGISYITIRKLSAEEIDRYAQTDDLSKYAGAYSITNSPQDFVTKIEGSITNVIGLPLEIILPILRENNFY